MALIRGKEKKSEAKIFTASMADIVFLLIVFFVVTYNVEVDRAQVKLPKTHVRMEIPEKPAYVSIEINSDAAGGRTYVRRVSNGLETSMIVGGDEEVVSFASSVVASDPEKQFVVKADADVPYRYIDEVLDALKQAKAKTIFLLSDQKTVDN